MHSYIYIPFTYLAFVGWEKDIFKTGHIKKRSFNFSALLGRKYVFPDRSFGI